MEAGAHFNLGQRIQRERENHHWTQKQLAEMVGGSVPSINRWEHNRSLPRPDLFALLTQVFGRPPEQWGTARPLRWNLPFLRNPYFTGRDLIIRHLHQVLAPIEVLSHVCVLSGLGGIGKTQTAIEYAYRYANDYAAILWVQADSRETLLSDFAALTHTLDLQDREETDHSRMIAAVKRWLVEQSRWLLIFDNAVDLTLLSEFLPRNPTGAILITTRSQFAGQLKHIKMRGLSRAESITFLSKRLASSQEDAEEDTIVVDQHEAEELWAIMDGLPLALDQAGAYIESRQCSLPEYLDLYHHHRKYLLQERGGPLTGHPDAVTTTWSLSFARIALQNPQAAELLRFCAFLSPDAIPEELLVNGAPCLTISLQTLAASSLLLHEAISALLHYSLVQRSPKNKTLSLHRLVQAVLQDMLSPREQHSWAEMALLAIDAALPDIDSYPWPQWKRLLPHAIYAAHAIERYHLTGENIEQLLHKTASYLQMRARYQEAEPLFLQAFSLVTQRLGSTHHTTASALNRLAHLYKEQGRYTEAEPLFLQAIRILEQQPGTQTSALADALSGLSVIRWQQEKYTEAEDFSQQALQIFECQLGSTHLEVARPLNTLAVLSWHKGHYDQAQSYLQRALHIREQQLGPEHPLVARVLNNLAALSWEQGQHAGVESIYQQVLRIWEQQMGPDHPMVATALNNLASIYKAHGKYAESEYLYQRASQIREHQVPPEYPNSIEMALVASSPHRALHD
jgi:tetratricopeptide (TPR) repeat protein/DNA-binding XRE family transcriptional regulator